MHVAVYVDVQEMALHLDDLFIGVTLIKLLRSSIYFLEDFVASRIRRHVEKENKIRRKPRIGGSHRSMTCKIALVHFEEPCFSPPLSFYLSIYFDVLKRNFWNSAEYKYSYN
mgnify:CR=1 FL=1